ncbi:uncharacterized protein LOC131225348 [Magnolia sinica]|uniref:uncharacterized protein LOC131225348 n=1 Tax=Magnolia sinica TaxID=86752 RepID=UPI00265B5351|nr:uncharacterized protein LOC131225348 [Magnolia sinica]
MGGKSFRMESHRHSYPYGNTLAWATSPSPSYASSYTEPEVMSRSNRRYSRIADNYNSLNQTKEASQLIAVTTRTTIVHDDKLIITTTSPYEQAAFGSKTDWRVR